MKRKAKFYVNLSLHLVTCMYTKLSGLRVACLIYMRSLAHIFYLLHVVCCSSGRQPFYKPAMPDGDDHHGGERPAPRADHRGPRGRHGGCPPRERVTLRHDHPLVRNTITLSRLPTSFSCIDQLARKSVSNIDSLYWTPQCEKKPPFIGR